MNDFTKTGLDRRTVVKGAAWSVPVLAAAVATPIASATGGFDVAVSAECSGDYDLAALEELLGGVLGGSLLVGAVRTALESVLGLRAGARRRFKVNVVTGPVPIGTAFQLTVNPQSLVTAQALAGVINANVSFVASANSGGVTFQTTAVLNTGDEFEFNFDDALLGVDALSTTTFSLVNPPGDANNANNTAAINTLASVMVSLGSLGLSNPVLNTLQLRVQSCGVASP